jgi:thioredoxin 1
LDILALEFIGKMKSSFKKLITADTPVLVDFHALWCGPCKMLAPVLKEVKDELGEKVKIIKIDVDQNQSLANKFQVRGVPTMMLFKNGEMVWRQSGLVPKEQILQAIKAA